MSTTLLLGYWNGSSIASTTFLSFFTGSYHKISITINRTAGTITVYRDGVLFDTKTGLTIAPNATAEYLYYGRFSDGNSLKGALGNIRMDSSAFTADEELRWANDPSSFDAQEKSVTASPNSLVVRDSTGNINVLSGAFTPTISFGGASVGVTYSSQVGFWTRIGNRVFFNIRMVLTNKGSSTGAAVISGLPFDSYALNMFSLSLASSAISFADQMTAFIVSGSKTIAFYENTNAGTQTTIDNTNFANTSYVFVDGSYIVS